MTVPWPASVESDTKTVEVILQKATNDKKIEKHKEIRLFVASTGVTKKRKAAVAVGELL